jgi:hypothetical protein
MSANPYAAPKAALEDRAATDYRRDGKNVVVTPGGALPPRCIRCNAPAVQPMKTHKLSWHHGAWYLLILVNIVVYIIVALIVRKRAQVTYGLCAQHHKRRRIFSLIGWVGFFLGFAAILVEPILGTVTAVAAILVGLFGSRLAYPTRITKEEVRLGGCGEPFLASLERPEGSLPVAAAGLRRLVKCPNCGARLPADAPQCLSCKVAMPAGAA